MTDAVRSKDDLEKVLLDPDQHQELFADPEKLKSWIEDYAKEVTSEQGELGKQYLKDVEEAAERGMQKFIMKNRKDGFTPGRLDMGGSESDRKAAPAKDLYPNPGFDTLGDFAKAVGGYFVGHEKMDDMLNSLIPKVLGESAGADGGFLVPDEFRNTIMSLALEAGVVRPRATVIPMSSLTLRMPTVRDTSHATNVFGGFQAFWTPEAGAITESQPTFGSVVLEAAKLALSTRINNELRQDAPALDGFLNQKAPEAINYFEDDAFINGIGVGQPLGLLNVDALVTVAKEGGQNATTIVWENLVKMFARLLPTSMGNAVWVINHDAFPQLATMSLSVGTGGSAIWLQQGVGSPPTSILGRPVLFTEKAQTLGTAGDIYLADFSQYLIGDRQTITAFASEHRYAETDQTLFRFTERVDGRPWIDSAITPRNGSNTLSPFVNLAVRS